MLSFNPSSPGTFNDPLTIVSNALASPSQLSLSRSSSPVSAPIPVTTLGTPALLLLMLGMLLVGMFQPRTFINKT